MRRNYNPMMSLLMSVLVFAGVSMFFRVIMFIPGVRLIVSLLFLFAPVLIFFLIRRSFSNFRDQFGRDFRGYEHEEDMRDEANKYRNNEKNSQHRQNNNEEIIAEVLEVKDLDEDE